MSAPRSLHSRIKTILLRIACVVFVLSAVIVGVEQFVKQKEQYAQLMRAQVKIARSLIQAQISQHDSRLRQICTSLTDKDVQNTLDAIGERLQYYDPFDIYYVLNGDGSIVQISREFSNYLGFNPSHMDHIREHRNISRVFQSIFSKRSVVALQYPLGNGLQLIYERDVQNVLPALSHLEDAKLLPAETMFLLTSEGVAVYHPDQTLVQSRHNLAFDLKQATTADATGLFTYLYHEQKFYAYREALTTPQGWSVYLQVPARQLTSAISQGIVLQLAALLAIFIIVTLAIEFALNRFFSKPVGRIVASLGEYDPTRGTTVVPDMQTSGILEFVQISTAINRMARDVFRFNERFRSSEEHIRLLLNSTAEAIYGLDLDGNCTFFNDSFLRIMGYENKEVLLGRNIHELIHHTKADGSVHLANDCLILRSIINGQRIHSNSEVFWRGDGSSFAAEYWSHPIMKEGVVSGAVVTFLDITDRKQAEVERNTAIERFRTLVDSLDAVVYVADLETYQLLFLNQRGRDLCPDGIGSPCWSVLQQGLTGPCPFCTNDKLLNADGSPAGVYIWEFQNTSDKEWYECRDQAIRWTDGRLVRMEIATNISARKQAEEEKKNLEARLRQSQKMEAIGTLAGGIAHDFNNILSAISGFAELAKREKDDPERLAADIGEVLNGAVRAKELVRQILTFSRRTEHKKQPLQIALVVKEALKLLRSSIPATIEIRENITSTSTALVDPTQIHQVIMNLCTNAYHAMRESGGTLTVALDDLEVTELGVLAVEGLAAGKHLRLKVSDTGCGMEASIRENIFEPYFTTRIAGEGTGLGLAVVHGIVESHNGSITVASEPGQGTTFAVFLPATEKDAVAYCLANRSETLRGGQERIMLVDDEEKIIIMTERLLAKYGYRVSAFFNGPQALQEFRKEPHGFDLVITDMTMPYMTGADLAQQLIAIRPDISILLCTGHSDVISREKALAMGIKEYCDKPVSLEKMLLTVRKVLDRRLNQGVRVMLVDDAQCNVDLGAYVLEDVGCEVFGFTDSMAALEKFRADPQAFDVVVTDQVMPALDGFDLARQVLATSPAIPVFMLTGNADPADRELAQSIGIREFFSKPLERDTIASAIAMAMAKTTSAPGSARTNGLSKS